MNKDTLILAVAAFFLGTALLRSQSDTPAKPPMEMLGDMKAANAAIIDQQKKTLDGLEQMEKAAEQIKALSKRS